MSEQSWKIYWNEYATDTYLYGAEVEFISRDRVRYRNELMPPGTVIKSWYSRTNYQMKRIEPSLPLIDGEGRYGIELNISEAEINSCLLRIVYYDRYGADAGSEIIRGGKGEFQCPLKTYSYEVQLINAGVKSLVFHSILITELSDDAKQKTVSKTEKSRGLRKIHEIAHRRAAAGKNR